ncbi:MAG: ATP-grasp domain-containing protein [Oligoflexales bacterium]|nr:ATP-grasp domain-containing protein [Oligoflexales bacterium]
MKKKTVVIIDPYLTGMKIAERFRQKGVSCIAVINWKNVPQFAKITFREEQFEKIIVFNNDIEKLIEELNNCKIEAVFPGTEAGVELAEILRGRLGINSNDSSTSNLRRNKFEMHEALRSKGLPVPLQKPVHSVFDLEKWIDRNEHEITWPLVLKPMDSAGTDGLKFCNSKAESLEYVVKLQGRENLLGKKNEFVLAQSFLDGVEYVVNTVSSFGKHRVSDIWRYHKKRVVGAGMIYDKQELLPFHGRVQEILIEYIFSSLDAIGVVHGPAHAEVMMTGSGPRLIEIASRIQGGINPSMLNACLGANQLDLAIDTALNPESFESMTWPGGYLKRHGNWINLICHKDGVAHELDIFSQKIRELKSYFSHNFSITEGMATQKTVNLFSSPGVVFLVHENPDIILEDYHFLRKLEEEFL